MSAAPCGTCFELVRKLRLSQPPHLVIPEIEAIATDELLALEAQGWRVAPTARAAALTMNREGIRRLAAETLGVPKHGRLEEGPALQAALATGNQARIDYYQGRLSLLRGIQPMLALVDVMDKQNVDALAIENATQALDDANFNGAVAIERAIAHGVLSEDPLGNVSFGIPSFHTYMIELRENGR